MPYLQYHSVNNDADQTALMCRLICEYFVGKNLGLLSPCGPIK